MHLEEIWYLLKRNRRGKKFLKLVLGGCLFLVAGFVLLVVAAILLAFIYHAQIYEGFMGIVNFLLGESPENEIRNFLQQLAEYFLKDLFSGD